MLTPEPLPKHIYNSCKINGIETINLEFSGGNDEGNLYISLYTPEGNIYHDTQLEKDIEDWAEEVYDYSGSGDGSDYGDTLIYNLSTMTVDRADFCMVREDTEGPTTPLTLKEEEKEEEE